MLKSVKDEMVEISKIAETQVDPRWIYAGTLGPLFLINLLLEWKVPLDERWAMSFRSFLNDLKYVVLNSGLTAGLVAFLALFTISISDGNSGPGTEWPLAVQVIAALLIFEFFNYWLHRAMHEAPGSLGRFLWRTHAAHHLPPRLYLVMHAVFHPINGIIIESFAIIIPIWFMGYSADAVTIFFMINGMHGLISHFNVDVRMGWMNFVFVGPELHRYHHSADMSEAKNYGNTLTLYDQLFGTFVYRPGIFPKELGVPKSADLPPYENVFSVLKLPFVK